MIFFAASVTTFTKIVLNPSAASGPAFANNPSEARCGYRCALSLTRFGRLDFQCCHFVFGCSSS